jgi:hypothetical protein
LQPVFARGEGEIIMPPDDSKDLKRARRTDDGDAFVPDAVSERTPIRADDAESFAEEFIAAALMGEPVAQDAADEVVDEEQGGPFIMLDDEAKLPEREEDEDGPPTRPDPWVRSRSSHRGSRSGLR